MHPIRLSKICTAIHYPPKSAANNSRPRNLPAFPLKGDPLFSAWVSYKPVRPFKNCILKNYQEGCYPLFSWLLPLNSLLPVLLHSHRVLPRFTTSTYRTATCLRDQLASDSLLPLATLAHSGESLQAGIAVMAFSQLPSASSRILERFRLPSCSAGAAFPLSFPPAVGHKRSLPLAFAALQHFRLN